MASLGTVYSIQEGPDTRTTLASTLQGKWSLATALALLAWYIFAPQCASTLATVRRETNSRAWTWFMFAYMLALAYVAAFVTYQVAVLLGGG